MNSIIESLISHYLLYYFPHVKPFLPFVIQTAYHRAGDPAPCLPHRRAPRRAHAARIVRRAAFRASLCVMLLRIAVWTAISTVWGYEILGVTSPILFLYVPHRSLLCFYMRSLDSSMLFPRVCMLFLCCSYCLAVVVLYICFSYSLAMAFLCFP